MKIAVIGASGKAGSWIVREALLRRHEVTAVVRDASRLENRDLPVLEKNLFDLTTDDLRPFDAVIDAFGTTFDPESAKAHPAAMAHLIEIMTPVPRTRLLVVGGAGSLLKDRASRRRVLEDILEQWRAVPESMAAAFDLLKASSVNWTYFSPAFTFDPEGPRTGKYVLGDDELTCNSEGESYLSYADFAVAMLDETEDGRFRGKRFTAASEKVPHRDGYWGTEPVRPQFEGLSNYRPPLNYELTGRTFRLVMDTTDDILVCFLTRNRLEYRRGGLSREESYECAKGAEMAYFVNFELTDVQPRTNITLFLDTMTRLVTVVTTWAGVKPGYPTLCDDKFEFGAIDIGGLPLPKKRHRYTMDLVGKRIHWHYGPDFSIIHVYYHTNFIRAAFTPERLAEMAPPSPERRNAWKENPYDEKATYVKLREGLYAVSFVEQSMARSGGIGNSLLFMMDTDRLHDVGRSFGHSGQFNGPGYIPENYLFGAYGEYVENDGGDTLDEDPPFYQVECIAEPDTAAKNSNGESCRYACAGMDEAESGSRPVRREKPYLGLRPIRPEFEGLSQYREPFNDELAGTVQRLVMDDGRRFSAEFLDGHTLRWTEFGQSGTVEHYDCAKGGEEVYFVNFEFAARMPRTNITLVLDTGDRLVTMAETVTGYHPEYPYMVDSRFTFGALEAPGCPLPERRHKYTADLLGKRIHWHYGPDMEIIHVYYATDYIRVTMPEKKGWGDLDRKSWDELMKREPYDEPAHYIKIKPGLYLVSCQEKNMASRGRTGNSLLFLIDTRRVHDVGRSFGHAGSETGKVHPENYIFGAFGEFVPSDGVLESQPNPYRDRQVR